MMNRPAGWRDDLCLSLLSWTLMTSLLMLESSSALHCKRLNQPENGEISFNSSSLTSGTVSMYSCHERYTLLGRAQRECQQDGSWSAAPPVCARECGLPPVVRNGHVAVTENCTHENCTASVVCKQGSYRTGSAQFICTPAGVWKNKETVTCIETLCSLTGLPKNLSYNTTREKVNGSFPYGTVLEFGCLKNLSLDGSVSSACTENGQWSNPLPRCVNATLDNRTSKKEGLELQTSPSSSPAVTGTSVLPTVTLASGGTTPKLHCPTLQQIPKAVVLVNGSYVRYHCEDGFVLVGVAEVACLENGTWSAEPPQCVASSTPTVAISHSTLTDSHSTGAATSESPNESSTSRPLFWKQVFLQSRNWSGTYTYKTVKQVFQFLIIDVTTDPHTDVKALFYSKDAKVEMKGHSKDNTNTVIVFEKVKSHQPGVTSPLSGHWSLEGQLYAHNGMVRYAGQICSQVSGFDKFKMEPRTAQITHPGGPNEGREPRNITLVLGVVIPVTFFVVALITAALVCHRRGSIKYAANGTLTSFENPVYDYEQSLR